MKFKRLIGIMLAAMLLMLLVPAQTALAATVTTPDGIVFDTSTGKITNYLGNGGALVIPPTIEGVPVTSIKYQAFNQSSLTSVTIPNSVVSIEFHAFEDNPLASITIPHSVTDLGSGVFFNCSSLMSIEVDPANPNYSSAGGVLFNKTQTALHTYPGGRSGAYTVPDTVTQIWGGAFRNCSSLTDITLPSGLDLIDYFAFQNCSGLTSITIPGSVSTIGVTAFENCDGISSITIPDSVTSILTNAFGGCDSLTSISVDPANPNYASEDGILFNKAKTTLIKYPGGLAGPFVIPGNVITIGEYAFSEHSGLTGITIPSGITSIESNAFSVCLWLEQVTIPGTVAHIGRYAFSNCSLLQSVTIESGVTSIGQQAFAWSGNYGCFRVPASVTSIEVDAFDSTGIQLHVDSGSVAHTYAINNNISFFIDNVSEGIMARTYYDTSANVACITYYTGATDASPRIQSDYYNSEGIIYFTEKYNETDTIIASVWFQDDGITKQFKNYYADGLLYFQEEFDLTDTIIASIWFQEDGHTRHFKNYYNDGVLYFQEEYGIDGGMIASIWFQVDGVTRHFKNYYSGYLYFQEECNVSGTMIASINFREDGTRERKCYYRVSDGSLYLIEYYDENEDCIYTEWF